MRLCVKKNNFLVNPSIFQDMKFTLNWLRQYLDFDLSPAALAERLTMLGLEVDSVEACAPPLNQVFVARIEAVHPHPQADKLVLCDVRVGAEMRRVVCGAPNARAGMLTAIAVPGAELPGGLKIKPAKIRGEASEGMLCSAKELQIMDEHAGIMDLPEDCTPGQLLVEALALNDTVIEVDLTPNRPDCASVLGIAREVGGIVGSRIRPPVREPLPVMSGAGLPFAVEVQAPDDCPRYAARLLTGIKIAASPRWLQQRLLAVGLRPINNIVDITNFVMMEYGQPLHAFDFRRLTGGKIIVRRAKQGETIETLDSVTRQLDPEMLLICDAERPVAIAGLMGGANSEVSDGTTEILLESACFDAISIRRTAGRLKLSTEASYRFERGIDPLGVPNAMERAVQLMVEIAGAQVVPDGIDFRDGVKTPPAIKLRVSRTAELIGRSFTAEEIARLLAAIEIKAEKIDAETLLVAPPSFRVDLEREIDLIEEVARLLGYNDIPTSLPSIPMSFPEADPDRALRKRVAQLMIGQGFYESINYSFVTPKHFDMFQTPPESALRSTVGLLNPLAEDQSVMRTLLLPGLLENLRRNVNYQNTDVRLFETGKVFYSRGSGQPEERLRLAAVLCGRRMPGAPLLYSGTVMTDIYDAKGMAEQLLIALRVAGVDFVADDSGALSYADPSACLRIQSGDKVLGHLGRITDSVLKAFAIKQEVFFLELDVDQLVQTAPSAKTFSPLPKFPSVTWDLAVVVPEEVAGGDMVRAVADFGESLVEHVEIFDVFRGKHIQQGMKSVGITITYRSAEQTLEDEAVDKVHKKITEMILSRFHGQLREV